MSSQILETGHLFYYFLIQSLMFANFSLLYSFILHLSSPLFSFSLFRVSHSCNLLLQYVVSYCLYLSFCVSFFHSLSHFLCLLFSSSFSLCLFHTCFSRCLTYTHQHSVKHIHIVLISNTCTLWLDVETERTLLKGLSVRET